ncbi:MAG: asparagine synthase C-terminal domain-containing protein, partial [Brevundimonas sp.]|nr:asparagine synthase C-terminal domain-containing protein [Brevundimonas sp.]
PWLVDCDDFGPAKAFQIAGVADSVSRHGRSPLTAAIDVRHPLCAQPVIETCLAIPAPLLALGGIGRGLARRAFQDRLPPMITKRRSKGDMTRIYGRMIADNLDVLRPWLLDGRLAAEGLIDRPALEAVLVRDDLMWRGQYSPIMRAAAFEGWLRVWGRRLEPRG